jgi:hypothetical protein
MGPLGQYLPNWLPEDPAKNAAARQGLITAGAALMGGRGNIGEILGGGLMAGTQGYQGALHQRQQDLLRQAQMQQIGLENKRLQNEIDEPAAIASINGNIGQDSQGAPQQPSNSIAALSALPRVGQAAATAPAMSQYETHMARAQALSAKGYGKAAKIEMDLAERARPKLKEQRVLTRPDGTRVVVNVDEYGQTSAVDGFAPDAEKLSFQNTGGSTVALDPFTGKPVSTIKNSVSPDAQLGADTARRGQNISAATAAQSNAKAPAGYRWAADGQSLEPIPGGPVTAKTSEQQQKVGDAQSVLGLLDMAQPLVEKATSSYGGAAADQVARVFGASTQGGESAAQLKAIEGSLISKMPKMSGPQSDKDVMLYRQMAGQIGDTTVPAANKLAAMKVIREINERYLEQARSHAIKPMKELPKKAAPPAGAPAAGTVKGGYRFKGGNPADKANWEKA